MKLTEKTLKEMIRKELKELNESDERYPFRPTAAGRALDGVDAVRKFRNSDPDDFTLVALASLILFGGGAMLYTGYEENKNRKKAARMIEQMSLEEIEGHLKEVELPDPTSGSRKQRKRAESDLEQIKIYTADKISKMSAEEIERSIISQPFETIYRNMKEQSPPEDQLKIQPETEPYRESLRRRRVSKK